MKAVPNALLDIAADAPEVHATFEGMPRRYWRWRGEEADEIYRRQRRGVADAFARALRDELPEPEVAYDARKDLDVARFSVIVLNRGGLMHLLSRAYQAGREKR